MVILVKLFFLPYQSSKPLRCHWQDISIILCTIFSDGSGEGLESETPWKVCRLEPDHTPIIFSGLIEKYTSESYKNQPCLVSNRSNAEDINGVKTLLLV